MLPEWINRTDCLHGDHHCHQLSLSESDGPNQQDLLMAARLAVSDAGITVRLRYFDDGREARQAEKAAREAISAGSHAVVGHFSSITALAASPLYEASELPFIAPGSSHPDLCRQKRNTLRFFGRDDEQLRCLIAGCSVDERVLILAQRHNYGERLADQLNAALATMSITANVYLSASPAIGDEKIIQLALQSSVVYLLGSQEFSFGLMQRYAFSPVAKVILSDDAYGPATRQLTHPNIAVPFLINCGGNMLDHTQSQLLSRAFMLSERQPGAYFFTSYLAIRALCDSWRHNPHLQGKALIAHLRQQRWQTPYGELTLSPQGELQGLKWGLISKNDLPVLNTGSNAR
ncbi:ABC transporter substrate-binding protein [Photorhabdus temperata]|uniref:Amino acid/amide ABC transporter substrate-binding protein, HAAT family n=1 Tax=Photorhabdus temperata subsp. temperata Meg1 TaxID=1393735 RepID=A0A081RZT5_PHOTE|nr:ABC transporter substrate-binding protein [Photorhabdus temperata]KER04188.1 amino acid/amide ABC transporter substrate-binding protein, HAAT family [Photorhabdus temperata subsp. temperata Meg1]MCT8348939.1 ABC transporter substrate-binding protein [Photorhabdus temperata]